jgi:hypothetical protein
MPGAARERPRFSVVGRNSAEPAKGSVTAWGRDGSGGRSGRPRLTVGRAKSGVRPEEIPPQAQVDLPRLGRDEQSLSFLTTPAGAVSATATTTTERFPLRHEVITRPRFESDRSECRWRLNAELWVEAFLTAPLDETQKRHAPEPEPALCIGMRLGDGVGSKRRPGLRNAREASVLSDKPGGLQIRILPLDDEFKRAGRSLPT